MEERERVHPAQSIKDYTGTIPLTREEFPSITNEDGTQSNILTEYVTVGDPAEPKYLLYPTMRRGAKIESPVKQAVEGGQHFGEYVSKRDMMKADSLIHNLFSNMFNQGRKHTPQVEDTIMKIMQDVDSLKIR